MTRFLSILSPIGIAFAFLIVNILSMLVILALNRRAPSRDRTEPSPPPPPGGEAQLSASEILGLEFEYAQVTASEANSERHVMVNFYLLIAGVIVSGVVAILAQDTRLPATVGTVLLWLLCAMGWLYFLGVVRLRQAWRDSAQAMNQIKTFYFAHTAEFDSRTLREAFRWQAHTLPEADKPWTIYFYSAMLISLLNSVAYVGGGALIHYDRSGVFHAIVIAPLAVLGLVFFAFHVWLYFAFLK